MLHSKSPRELTELELELLGIPILQGDSFPELDASKRVLFQRCCEIYRVTEHFGRQREFMLQIFTEFRTREQFESALSTHYFETDEALTSDFDPEFYSVILGAYHFIRTLSLSLRHTTALPTALSQQLVWAEANLTKTWNRIAAMAEEKYSWKLKRLSESSNARR